jgi:hypothetical protein
LRCVRKKNRTNGPTNKENSNTKSKTLHIRPCVWYGSTTTSP